ncbi:hypothetical protein STAL104432_04890 [Streptomyces albus]
MWRRRCAPLLTVVHRSAWCPSSPLGCSWPLAPSGVRRWRAIVITFAWLAMVPRDDTLSRWVYPPGTSTLTESQKGSDSRKWLPCATALWGTRDAKNGERCGETTALVSLIGVRRFHPTDLAWIADHVLDLERQVGSAVHRSDALVGSLEGAGWPVDPWSRRLSHPVEAGELGIHPSTESVAPGPLVGPSPYSMHVVSKLSHGTNRRILFCWSVLLASERALGLPGVELLYSTATALRSPTRVHADDPTAPGRGRRTAVYAAERNWMRRELRRTAARGALQRLARLAWPSISVVFEPG